MHLNELLKIEQKYLSIDLEDYLQINTFSNWW